VTKKSPAALRISGLASLYRSMGSQQRPPPDPIKGLVVQYTPFIRSTLVRAGVRQRDVPDLVQEVIEKLRAAISGGLDTSIPLHAWLRRTTHSMARDVMNLARNAREEVTATGVLGGDTEDPTPNPEERMAQIDVSRVVHDILDELSWPHRSVLVMADMDDMPMSEIAEIHRIKEKTGYSRLYAARERFRAIWNERRTSAAVAPFALWEASALIAAERRVTPEAPQSFQDDMMRRLNVDTGASGGIAAKLAAAGRMVLTGHHVAIAVVCILLGAALAALLRPPSPHLPSSPTIAMTASREAAVMEATPAPPASIAPTPSAMPSGSTSATAFAPTGTDERKILETARLVLDRGNAAGALALLERVTSPRYAQERDELRELAISYRDGGGHP
jgi:RNA polymerase sigma-70 factor, ECF subfamily